MPTGEDWTIAENAVTARAYLSLLEAEFRGHHLMKKSLYGDVARKILRSEKAVEYKFQNISAVLQELSHPWVEGLKPAMNYQAALRDAVVDALAESPSVAEAALAAIISEPPRLAPPTDFQFNVVAAPVVEFSKEYERTRRAIKRDYAMLDASNRAVGLAGELAVVEHEKAHLRRLGLRDLAALVEHVSQTRGDGLGFDIRSFTPDGETKFIEVKTTRLGPRWPMLVSRNEVELSREVPERFHLYRVFHFDRPEPGLYRLAGDISTTCQLRPEVSSAVPRRQIAG